MYTIEDAIYEDAEITGYFKGKKEGEIAGQIKGKKKGIKEANENVIRSLMINHNFSDQQIKDYTNISISFIRKTRVLLEAEKSIH